MTFKGLDIFCYGSVFLSKYSLLIIHLYFQFKNSLSLSLSLTSLSLLPYFPCPLIFLSTFLPFFVFFPQELRKCQHVKTKDSMTNTICDLKYLQNKEKWYTNLKNGVQGHLGKLKEALKWYSIKRSQHVSIIEKVNKFI